MFQKGYAMGSGVFSTSSKNDSVLSQYDYSKKSKQDKERLYDKSNMYPSLDDEKKSTYKLSSEQAKSKQQPSSSRNQFYGQASDAQDDDNEDYHLLLNQLETLNLSDIMPFDNSQTNQEAKKQGKKKVKEPEQFMQMLNELNRAEEKQEKQQLMGKLNQKQIKSLILGSYFNRILSFDGLVDDLEYILEFCQGATRIPSSSKRTLLLFLEEVIEQVGLDAKQFSISNAKFKIDKSIPEAIWFGQSLETHFNKQKSTIIRKLIQTYMKMDYVHSEAKKIFYRNTKKIIDLYKEYLQKTRPSKKAKQSSPNQNPKILRSQSYQLSSQVTQSQDFYFEPKQKLSKKQTQSTYNYQPESDQEDLFEVKSTAFVRSRDVWADKKQENHKQFAANQNNNRMNTPKNQQPQKGELKNEKSMENIVSSIGDQKKKSSSDQKKLKDRESQTQHVPLKINQYSVNLQFKQPEQILSYETAGNSPRLLTSSQYCNSIFGQQLGHKFQEIGIQPSVWKIEKQPSYKEKQDKLQYSYISDNLESGDESEITKNVFNFKNKPEEQLSSIHKKNDNSQSANFSLSLSLNTSKNPPQQIIIRDKDQKYLQNRDKEVFVQAHPKQKYQQKSESDDSGDDGLFQSDSDSSGNQYTNQLLDMTRIIDASLNDSSKKKRPNNYEDSWESAVILSSSKAEKMTRKPAEQPKQQKAFVKKIQRQPPLPVAISETVTASQPYRKLGSSLKQKLAPLLQQFQANFIKYQKSKPSFHVGPRRQMFNFLDAICIDVDKIRKSSVAVGNSRERDEELGVKIYKYFSQDKIKQLKGIFAQYNSDYFHQPAKLGMFGDVKTLIKLYKEYK